MNKNKLPEIVLIGLPNSGKSTLINALCKNKTSIIGSEPNTTRDKVSNKLVFEDGRGVLLSDLPGYLEHPDEWNLNFQKRIEEHVKNADKILFVIDVNSKDFINIDYIYKFLNTKNYSKKVITVFNKSENLSSENLDPLMYKYILNQEFFISAYHKKNLEGLRSHIYKISKNIHDEDLTKKITIIGRPNAGKSTLFNSLLNQNRSVVSDVPGTTRDKINEVFNFDKKDYSLTDTAGIPRTKQKNQIDRYSSTVALNELENTDIALIVVDGTIGLTFEDKRILKASIENIVTPIVILNKWDLLDTEEKNNLNSSIKRELKQYSWVNVLRLSALNSANIKQLFKSLNLVENQLEKRIGTSELNTFIRYLWSQKPPHPFRGRRAKLKYVTQFSTNPPEFSFNVSSQIPKNYISFLESNIRNEYDMGSISFKIKINA